MKSKTRSEVPKSLRIWFIIHFITDMVFAIPLILFPTSILGLFGLKVGDYGVTARLVGAALIGIGGVSFLVRNQKIENFSVLLSLKILWSLAAVIGLILAIISGAPAMTWLIVIAFSVFSSIWMYYKYNLRI